MAGKASFLMINEIKIASNPNYFVAFYFSLQYMFKLELQGKSISIISVSLLNTDLNGV